jgi:hypothetical protein
LRIIPQPVSAPFRRVVIAMRLLSLLILLAGIALGIGYPWVMNSHSAHEIGTWRVQDAASGYRPVVARIGADDAPIEAVLDVAAVRPANSVAGQSVVTVTAAVGGKTVLAETLDFADAVIRDDSPQTLQQIYRLDAGSIAAVEPGDYTFTVGPGDAEGVDVLSVDPLLSGGRKPVDERAEPIGFSAMAIGFILLALSFRKRAPSAGNPNSQPPPPRWGRGGGTA